ncbi:transketolase [Magnetospira sp. QH-2]|uniref:transketolase n=1 Tax=Magnetospira sp. (strain QH-2) TaxID=1288970 RepID=UPI0003E815C2|nr:transketolase [Magnetospira sp. QH-2]CCQ73747.1 Transketolase (TK) [Magnetospira sp. QH-2]
MSATHQEMANAIRFLAADAVQKAKSGHPGMPMGMADVATVLFTKFMKYDPSAPKWADRDRFILSAGHGSMLLYSLLHLMGVEDFSMEELSKFRQLGSRCAGHPEYGHGAGIEATAGPLGQGISMAVGMALAERMMNARYGNDLVDHYTYVIAGDGCLMEGISQEALSIAGHMKLNKLIVMWDDNEICIDGKTNMTLSDDQLARFTASNWNVMSIDGHDPKAIEDALTAAKASDKPTLIGCKSTIGFGAPTLAGSHHTHGAPLGDEEIAGMRKALNWDAAPFTVPDNVLAAWRAAGAAGSAPRESWEGRLNGSAEKAEFMRLQSGDLPGGWEMAMNDYKKKMADEQPTKATRQASGMALEVLADAVPEMIGGSADLTGSVNTKTSFMNAIQPGDYGGRYMHYGVREHGMAAVMNGMALHGEFIPYSGTFAVFADYMRGAMRLSALMEQRVVYVLTHDSIGLGEDGPTHQPVETVANLRALPNFNVYRPADVIEAAECWASALTTKSTPSGMILSRQGLPAVRVTHTDENLCARGGYVLREAEGGDRKVTLMATGSEVSVAMAARDQLQADGVPTAVVSMPCFELFDAQDQAYKDSVLGATGGARVAVEAAVQQGWDKYLGSNGGFIGMTGFGASAPAPDLYKHFGITADAVAAEAKSLI